MPKQLYRNSGTCVDKPSFKNLYLVNNYVGNVKIIISRTIHNADKTAMCSVFMLLRKLYCSSRISPHWNLKIVSFDVKPTDRSLTVPQVWSLGYLHCHTLAMLCFFAARRLQKSKKNSSNHLRSTRSKTQTKMPQNYIKRQACRINFAETIQYINQNVYLSANKTPGINDDDDA